MKVAAKEKEEYKRLKTMIIEQDDNGKIVDHYLAREEPVDDMIRRIQNDFLVLANHDSK